MTIEHQDQEIILINPYEYTGFGDSAYLRIKHYSWMLSTVGNDYRVLLNRNDRSLIYIDNEYYQSKYQAIETSLVGDVLILGMGVAILDQYLTTGTSWKWVEKNEWLATNIIPVNGTVHQGNAEDEVFIATLGTFDTILIDFAMTNGSRTDWDQFLNPGGSIIEMRL